MKTTSVKQSGAGILDSGAANYGAIISAIAPVAHPCWSAAVEVRGHRQSSTACGKVELLAKASELAEKLGALKANICDI